MKGELKYKLRIDEPFLLLNKLQRMHWSDRKKYHQRLYWLLRQQITSPPRTPLLRCRIHVTRGNPPPLPDLDGLYGGVKPLLDCLVVKTKANPLGMGFIMDDNQNVIEELKVESVKTRRCEGFTEIRIYQAAKAEGVKAA